LKRRGVFLHFFSKIDSLLRHIIENHPLAAEDGLDVDEIHLQPTLRGELAAGGEPLLDPITQPLFGREILERGEPENLAPKRILEERRGSFSRRAENFADLRPSIAPDDHSLTSGMGLPFQALILANVPHLAIANDESIHGR
jgi:hypothetical protein